MRPVDRNPSFKPWSATRTALVALLTLGLAACSLLTLAYQQTPRVISSWASQQAQLSPDQSDALRDGLENSLQWHQREVLPAWIDVAKHWAARAPADWSATELCQDLERVRAQVKSTLQHSLLPWAQLAQTLSAAQLAALAKSRADAQQDFREDFIEPSASAVLERRLERAQSQWERLYGDLSAPQIARLRAHLARSPWEPIAQQHIRQQHEAALLRLLHQARTEHWGASRLQTALGAWLDAIWSPPDAPQRAQQASFWSHSCEMIADMHRRSDAKQRRHLALQLHRYAEAFEGLIH